MKTSEVVTLGAVVLTLMTSPAASAEKCPPEIGEAKAKITSLKKTQAEVRAPRTAAGARTYEATAPRGQEQQNPRGQEQQNPRGQEQQNPRGQEQQNPRGQEQQNPRGQEQQNPRGQEQQNPRGQEQQNPRGRSNRTRAVRRYRLRGRPWGHAIRDQRTPEQRSRERRSSWPKPSRSASRLRAAWPPRQRRRVRRSMRSSEPRRRIAWLLALALALGACTVGPNYRRPEYPVPATFRGAPAEAAPSIAGLAWWRVFEDEILQQLIRIALQENYDLRIAAARILEARAQVTITRSFQFPEVNHSGSAIYNRVEGDLGTLQFR